MDNPVIGRVVCMLIGVVALAMAAAAAVDPKMERGSKAFGLVAGVGVAAICGWLAFR